MAADVPLADSMQPMYHYGAVDLGGDAYAGFSLANTPIQLDGNQSFSLGGWFRPLSTGQFFNASAGSPAPSISLSIGSDVGTDFIQVDWPSVGSFTSSGIPLSLGDWHYLLVTYATNGNRSGTLSFYIDGAAAGQSPIAVGGDYPPSSGTVYILGGYPDPASCQCVCFSIWSVCLQEYAPIWGPPSSTANLAVCCDFSVVPAQDRSGNNIPIYYSEEDTVGVFYPSLLLGDANYAQPSPIDAINPGGGTSPFSIYAWVYPHAMPAQVFQTNIMAVVANGELLGTGGLVTYLQFNPAQSTLQWCVQRGGQAGTVVASSGFAPDQWHHVAVTYDGTTLTLYVDGQQSATAPSGATTPLARPLLRIGAAPDSTLPEGANYFYDGYLQAIGIWPSCLSASDIATYMYAEPDETTNCAAYYSLGVGKPSNAMTSEPVALLGAAAVTELAIHSSPSQTSFAPRALPASTPAARTASMRDLPIPPGLDLTTKPVSSLLSSEQIDAILADYERLLVALAPPDLRAGFRDMFTRNLYLGLHLQEAAAGRPTPGTVSFAREGNEVVFYHHTVDGAQEIARLDGASVDDCTAWIGQVVATAVGVLLSFFGFGYSFFKLVQKFFIPWLIRYPSRAAVLNQVVTENISGMTVVQVVRTLSGMTSLSTIISNALANVSWWSWAWTVASLAVQIASIWLTGGLYLLYVVAQLALSIGQLVTVIGDRPQGCNPPAKLSGLVPSSVAVGSPGFQLTVNGQAFVQGAAVQWNGQARATTFTSSTQVTAAIAAADLGQAGWNSVTALNPASNNRVSNTLTFTVTPG